MTLAPTHDDVIKKGYVKIRGKNLGFWARRYIVLRRPSSRGPCRIDKYEDERCFSKDKAPLKSIMVSDISSVERLTEPGLHAFGIASFDGYSRQVSMPCESTMDEWLSALNEQCSCIRLDREGSRSGSDDDDLIDSNTPFPVNLMPHHSTSIEGECYLQVSDTAVSLYDAEEAPRMKLLHWPLESIHRYGKDSTKFTLEVNSHCLTGAGTFIFKTHDSSAIYKRFRSIIRERITHQEEVCQRVRERNLRAQLPRIKSQRTFKKSLTDGCLLLPGHLYDPALFEHLDYPDGLPHSASSSPTDSGPQDCGLEFIIGSC